MSKLPYSGPTLAKLLAANDPRRRNARTKTTTRAADAAHDASTLLQQGLALQLKGSIGLAAEIYQNILAKNPNNPDALHLMGTIAMAGGQIDPAIGFLQRAVAGKPGDPSIRCNLASMLLQKNDTDTAEFHLRKALKTHPDLPNAQCFLAECKAMAGDRTRAAELYEAVLARLPNELQALIGYGDLCLTLGDIPKAQSLFRRALSQGAVSAAALAGLAACERPAKDSPEAAAITDYLRKPGLKPIEYVNLSYVAAEIAEDAGDYDQAFAQVFRAKSLSASTYDMAAQKAVFETLKKVFTKAFFETRGKYGDVSARPVFIVGMPRSGTTLAEQIISCHPQAAAAGELGEMTRIAGTLGFRTDSVKDFAKQITKLRPAESKVLASRYLSALDRVSATALKVTDKLPHNFLRLGLIALLFPNAKIVHCRRNPLDTCVSCFTTQLRDHYHGYTIDLETLGLYYREYDALMDHWQEVLPLPIFDLEYEQLVETPEHSSRQLIEFIGLPWDPACLAPQESKHAVWTQSRMQVRRPIYRASVGRWRRYEKHLGPLKDALTDLIADRTSEAAPPA